MALPKTIAKTLSDTLSYKLSSGYAAGGVPSWGSLLTASAKVWEKYETHLNPNGEVTVTTHVIHTDTDIPKGSLVFLPDDSTADDENGHIVDVANRFDSSGVCGPQWTLYVLQVKSGK